MSTVDKVCPVVFRDASMRQILAFEHPRAGVQLVKRPKLGHTTAPRTAATTSGSSGMT